MTKKTENDKLVWTAFILINVTLVGIIIVLSTGNFGLMAIMLPVFLIATIAVVLILNKVNKNNKR